jgi:hypothetical protein
MAAGGATGKGQRTVSPSYPVHPAIMNTAVQRSWPVTSQRGSSGAADAYRALLRAGSGRLRVRKRQGCAVQPSQPQVVTDRRAERGCRRGTRLHDLRHAGLTMAAQAGSTLKELMRMAGHPRRGLRCCTSTRLRSALPRAATAMSERLTRSPGRSRVGFRWGVATQSRPQPCSRPPCSRSQPRATCSR